MENDMRLIDANKMLKIINSDDWKRMDNLAYETYTNLIEEQPTVDAEPVKHGYWKYIRQGKFAKVYECSRCGRAINANCLNDFPYCHCGAKMNKEV